MSTCSRTRTAQLRRFIFRRALNTLVKTQFACQRVLALSPPTPQILDNAGRLNLIIRKPIGASLPVENKKRREREREQRQ